MLQFKLDCSHKDKSIEISSEKEKEKESERERESIEALAIWKEDDD